MQVTAVTTQPPFTLPGASVDVQARILNAVNTEQQAMVAYIVTDSSGTTLFTSTPVPTTLNVLSTLSTIDLGSLDTSGFALGQDTITVTVTDASGHPIPGATVTGSILIGTPVTASLSTSPISLPQGSGTVTTTLQIESQSSYTSPLGLVGTTSISGSSGVAVSGSLAYVGSGSGIDVVDVSDPTTPTVQSTFGSSDFPGMTVVALEVSSGNLVALVQNSAGDAETLLIYSLANPSSPTLLGQTPITISGASPSFLTGFTRPSRSQQCTLHSRPPNKRPVRRDHRTPDSEERLNRESAGFATQRMGPSARAASSTDNLAERRLKNRRGHVQ